MKKLKQNYFTNKKYDKRVIFIAKIDALNIIILIFFVIQCVEAWTKIWHIDTFIRCFLLLKCLPCEMVDISAVDDDGYEAHLSSIIPPGIHSSESRHEFPLSFDEPNQQQQLVT